MGNIYRYIITIFVIRNESDFLKTSSPTFFCSQSGQGKVIEGEGKGVKGRGDGKYRLWVVKLEN